MRFLSIIVMSVLAAVIYGIVHDQITARICVEYFTIGHARLIDSDSPTLLGFFWGIVATWWVGLPLGFGLAVAARCGRPPKLQARDLVQPLIRLLVVMFVLAAIAGTIGFVTSSSGMIRLVGPLAELVPAERHVAFLTCGWAHSASYLAGLVGGVVLWIVTWRRRGKLAV
ncbi:hypothetical protein [Luteolibacter marinus]|uniref:hypothetical protein n=1 Tax=Luteolibacter marinus TaxID=2776705 RepID=UPI0018691B5C|nr:hypothetical protein [Luteolibacter marinus]